MILEDMSSRNVEDAFVRDEAYRLDRTLPELEWDERESALVVEGIVGGTRMRADF